MILTLSMSVFRILIFRCYMQKFGTFKTSPTTEEEVIGVDAL